MFQGQKMHHYQQAGSEVKKGQTACQVLCSNAQHLGIRANKQL
jgi:hypothetical protein